jgi:hypothetical protein
VRRHARVDGNQSALVADLRKAGFRVEVVSMLGAGRGDLIVARNGLMRWVEVKDPSQPPSARKLTPDEADWQARWEGYVITVTSLDEVLDYWARLRA